MSKTSPSNDPGKKPSRPRRIVLRLTAREKTDNAEAIRELREALKRPGEFSLRVETIPDRGLGASAPEPPPPVRNIALEVKIGEDVRVHLDTKATTAPPAEADPVKAEQIKKALWKWLAEKAAASWRVTVVAGLEWAKKQLTG